VADGAISGSSARLWDADTGTEARVLKGHTDQVRSASFSPDGKRVVILKGHTDQVRSAAFSPDGKRVVTASADTNTGGRRPFGASGRKHLGERRRRASFAQSLNQGARLELPTTTRALRCPRPS
jgi:hypothetical protein